MSDNNRISTIVDHLTKAIFSSEVARLTKREMELVRENARLPKSAPDGFFYRGQLYSDLDPKLRAKGTRGNLHPSLHPQMDAHLKDKGVVDFDRQRVKQALAIILRDCKTHQDFRDALPNSLKDFMGREVGSLPRTRPEAYTVQENPRAYRQYMQLREKLEFYNVAKLLY